MSLDFILIGKASTLSAQLAEIRARALGIVPPIREGGPFDGRAVRPQDAEGFLAPQGRREL